LIKFIYTRYVLHWSPPTNILDYVQETGRCCRDGEEGTAILYCPPYSFGKNHKGVEKVDPVFKAVLKVWKSAI